MLASKLAGKRVVLASGSPRRKQILEMLGLQAEVVPSTFPETLDKSQFASPDDYVLATATGKAEEVYQRIVAEGGALPVVLAADTIVSLGPDILEKPVDEAHARTMLSNLSGKAHHVLTAVVVLHPDVRDPSAPPHESKFVERTEVVFANLTEDEISSYIATGEPFDKAGGYGYQTGAGSTLVEKINGCYYNVVGFPTSRFVREVRTFLDGLP